ncbi:MAG: MazG-like family protein [Lachnospiraceae bacterium]|nr:MazG-like family protein [Lachnospiraceae bacterium]
MEKLKQLAIGMNHRFPEGDDAFQITTRLLEECGEVAKEVNRLEKSGTKVLRHGKGTKEDLASEIKDAMNALMQLAIHYDAVEEVQASIEKSIEQLTLEGYIKGE